MPLALSPETPGCTWDFRGSLRCQGPQKWCGIIKQGSQQNHEISSAVQLDLLMA